MRECASQGEQRAAVLTLVLAEWENSCLVGQKPLLLLDDVMSELDESRRRALVRIVTRGGQVIITTTDLRYFSDDELQERHGDRPGGSWRMNDAPGRRGSRRHTAVRMETQG